MNKTMLTMGVITALALGACAQEDRGQGQGTAVDPSADRSITPREAASQAPEAMPETQSSTATETPMAGMPANTNAPATLAASSTSGPDGRPHLVDGAGVAVYMVEGDTDGTKCTGECLQAWPPLLVTDTRPAPSGSLPAGANVGSIKRPDGSTQVTYNGHPLYHYAADTGRGRTAGHGVKDQWGRWSLLTPQGEPAPAVAGSAGANSGAP